MTWWVWLVVAWVAVAAVLAIWFGSALRNSEARDWERRGRPDRRAARRDAGYEEWVRSGRPERRNIPRPAGAHAPRVSH